MEGVVEGLEAPPNLLLGNLGQRADLLECTRHTLLSARNKDAGSDNTLVRLAAQQFLVFDTLKELLGDIGCFFICEE